MVKSTTFANVETYAGIDYHKKFSVITLGDKDGRVLRTERVPNDRQSVTQFFRQFPGLICTVESCRGYEWFVELLQSLGLTVHLCHAYAVKLIAQSRCKTDKIDSKILMELLAKGFCLLVINQLQRNEHFGNVCDGECSWCAIPHESRFEFTPC
jgi:transposase